MIKNINFDDFCNGFPQSYQVNFSDAGKRALYDHLEDLEEDTGEAIEYDPVALCCNYTEYPTAWKAMEQYQPDDMPTVDNSEDMDLIELHEASEKLALEWLREKTQVIEFDEGVIIQACLHKITAMNFANITLGELLSSTDVTIKRNALSVLKQLQREADKKRGLEQK